jgi:hypothetical protein
VTVPGGIITVLRFGNNGDKSGYMLFDTHEIPIGTTIRGEIIGYTEPPSHKEVSTSVQDKPSRLHGKNDGARVGASQPSTVMSAPNGIVIGGGNVSNPTVNNYGHIQRHLSPQFITEVSSCLSETPGKVWISAIQNNGEAFVYAQDWYNLFHAGNWYIDGGKVRTFMLVGAAIIGTNINFRGTVNADRSSVKYDNSKPSGHFVDCVRNRRIDNGKPDLIPSSTISEDTVSISVGNEPPNN